MGLSSLFQFSRRMSQKTVFTGLISRVGCRPNWAAKRPDNFLVGLCQRIIAFAPMCNSQVSRNLLF